MSTPRERILLVTTLVVILALLSGCIAPQQADQISLVETRQVQGEAIVKTLQANNCTNTEDMKQDMQAVHQYNHDIEVTPNPGLSVNRRAVVDEIRAYYRIPDGPSDAVCVIPVTIPAGAFYSYDIEWIEVWREGIFETGDPDGDAEGNYRFRQSMLCEVVAQRAEVCPAP
ncbi:MAG: hypothetical protein AB1894_17790 [Chloroflexota bacterium]